MFLCTWCATGTEDEKDSKDKSKVESKADSDSKDDDDEETASSSSPSSSSLKASESTSDRPQRAFLSCDLCASKMTESYYCPHCLAAYPAHYVKLRTRCTRCVMCPVCTSPLEKIVYSGVGSKGDSKKKD